MQPVWARRSSRVNGQSCIWRDHHDQRRPSVCQSCQRPEIHRSPYAGRQSRRGAECRPARPVGAGGGSPGGRSGGICRVPRAGARGLACGRDAHATEPEGGTPNGGGDQLGETEPISGDPNAGQPAAGGVLPRRGAQTDSAKQSKFVANCLPDHELRAGGTLGPAIS
jgi:hypothetical protein